MEWSDIKGELTVDFGDYTDADIIDDDPNAQPPPVAGLDRRRLDRRWGLPSLTKDASVSVNMDKSLGRSATIWA